jgi:hypothetical protein
MSTRSSVRRNRYGAVCNAVICGVETRLLLENAGLADVVIATI